MILIVIPTLDYNRGLEVGRRAQIAAACDTRLVVIHDKRGQGFTKTANRGLQRRKPGEDVCLLNDDIITFNYGWLKILSEALRLKPKRGIVGPSGKSAGIAKRGRVGDYGTRTAWMLPFWCVLISHGLLDDLGYLNENLIHYSSDTLYCVEARQAGWHIEWVKSVYLWHQHEGSGFRRAWRDHDSMIFNKLMGR